jgi:hypothetical protein
MQHAQDFLHLGHMIVLMDPGMFHVPPLAFHFSLVVSSHLTGKEVWNSGHHFGSVTSNEVVS